MRYLFITRGLPGSGKSTFLKECGLSPFTISSDYIRLQYSSPIIGEDGNWTISQTNNKLVWEKLFEILDFRMKNGDLTVVDATHTLPSQIHQYNNLCQKHGYKSVVIDFTDVELSTVLERNAHREPFKRVSEDVIKGMNKLIHTPLEPSYTVIKPSQLLSFLKFKPTIIDEYEKVVVFGDVHSCYNPLKEYFDANPISQDTLYVFCGDYFDRGEQPKEVLSFLLEHLEDKNFIFIEGNHEKWIQAYSRYGEDTRLSKDFRQTLVDLGEDRKKLHLILPKLVEMVYLKLGELKMVISHGGISELPNLFIPSRQYIYGTGRFDGVDFIDNLFNERYNKSNVISIHGHRNTTGRAIVVGHTCNLEGGVEKGGCLRGVEIIKQPLQIKPFEITCQLTERIEENV